MRNKIAKVWGASAMLSLGTACGGSSVGGGGAGSGGVSVTAGAGGSLSGAAGSAGSPVTTTGGTAGDSAANGGAAGLAGMAGGPPVDIGAQQTAEKLDVLFVVDNSASMSDKQGVLEASLPTFVNRLVNPRCVDAQGNPSAQQPASGADACSSGKRELTPVKDLHLGVITTSIGGHGGTVCSPDAALSPTDQLDDQAELIPTKRSNLASYNGAGFVSFDAAGQTGVSDIGSAIKDLSAMVAAAGQHGCGYEAPLEAMYRFLVDPEPPLSVVKAANTSTPTGINDVLLAQRKAFLRPDSAVAIVILSDENDCSIRDDGVGWYVASYNRMPLATVACDSNPNDACCRSCAEFEVTPPTGCAALTADANCKSAPLGAAVATSDALHDALNLRCYHQQQRFGFDLLYPVERYSNALSNPKISNLAGALVDNPLFAARDGKGPRSATLISVSTIIGAPWQDLATSGSLSSGGSVQNLNGAELAAQDRWPLLLGDPASNVPPSDPFMNESIAPRSGENPLTHDKIMPATSLGPSASVINGHEQNVPQLDDLQFACTFPLLAPKVCGNDELGCDCAPDTSGSLSYVTASNSPLCQAPAGGAVGSTQYYAKGYPGARELRLVQLLGARAVPGSICPRVVDDSTSADYGYFPAFDALLTRIATTLK